MIRAVLTAAAMMVAGAAPGALARRFHLQARPALILGMPGRQGRPHGRVARADSQVEGGARVVHPVHLQADVAHQDAPDPAVRRPQGGSGLAGGRGAAVAEQGGTDPTPALGQGGGECGGQGAARAGHTPLGQDIAGGEQAIAGRGLLVCLIRRVACGG